MDKKQLTQLKRDLTTHKKIVKAAGNERDALKYLKIDSDKIMSTDSFRIVKTSNLFDNKATGYLHIDDIDKVKKNPDEIKKYLVKNVDYPNIKKVIPQFSSYLKIDGEPLKRACKMASGYWRDGDKTTSHPIIGLKLKNKMLTVFIREELIKTKIKIPVMSTTRKYLHLLLNPTLLFDIIPASGTITIKINKGNQPIAFNNNIIMPVTKS